MSSASAGLYFAFMGKLRTNLRTNESLKRCGEIYMYRVSVVDKRSVGSAVVVGKRSVGSTPVVSTCISQRCGAAGAAGENSE